MTFTYRSEIEPMDIDEFKRLVASNNARAAYNLVAEYQVAITEERIIKLLEELDIKVFGRLVYNDSRDELIALIKGENK